MRTDRVNLRKMSNEEPSAIKQGKCWFIQIEGFQRGFFLMKNLRGHKTKREITYKTSQKLVFGIEL